MGLIGKILAYIRITDADGLKKSEIKCDMGFGANANITREHFQGANTDSVPLKGDFSISTGVHGTGASAFVGFLDPNQNQTSGPGEHRIYSRRADGTEVAELFLKNNGQATLSNDNGSVTLAADGSSSMMNPSGCIKLMADGSVDINGFIITARGAASSPLSLSAPSISAAGLELAGHFHTSTAPSTPTGPNLGPPPPPP